MDHSDDEFFSGDDFEDATMHQGNIQQQKIIKNFETNIFIEEFIINIFMRLSGLSVVKFSEIKTFVFICSSYLFCYILLHVITPPHNHELR